MEEKKKKFQVPHVYILLIGIILICAILTYIIPAGSYEMMTLESGREVVDPSTYATVDKTPVSLMGFLTSIPRGMIESAQIIFFIFIVGGSFTVLQDTGAVEAGLGRLIKSMSGAEIIIIPVIMFAFSLGGAVIGMAEETLAFIPIMVSLAIAMGYDSLTGVGMVLIGAGAGFAGAFMNPFTIGVAQGIAGLPLFSGKGLRIVLYVIMVAVSALFVMRYAMKIKKEPTLSPMHAVDIAREDKIDLENLKPFGGKEKLILLVFLASIILLIWGVVKQGWYMNEIAALFLGMSMLVAIVGRMGFNNYAESLGKGMAGIAGGALVVGIARGILVVMTDGQILHTILHSAASFLGTLPSSITAVGMYVFQCLLNFLVPSGSGQAAVSIPIMAPLGDLVGVTRQTACLAYQLGDGISNIFTPTSGYFMAGLALAKIPWAKWAKWFLPLLILQYLIGAAFVIYAQVTGFGPF